MSIPHFIHWKNQYFSRFIAPACLVGGSLLLGCNSPEKSSLSRELPAAKIAVKTDPIHSDSTQSSERPYGTGSFNLLSGVPKSAANNLRKNDVVTPASFQIKRKNEALSLNSQQSSDTKSNTQIEQSRQKKSTETQKPDETNTQPSTRSNSSKDPNQSTEQEIKHSETRRLTDTGMVEFEDDIQLSSKESGIVDKMLVREGDVVEIDSVVCELSQKQLKHALASAKAQEMIAKISAESNLDTKTAKTAIHYAERAVERVKDRSVFTEEEADQRLHELERAKLALIQAEQDKLKSKHEYQLRKAEVAIAEQRLKDRTIKSPINGMVISVDAKKGEWVNEGQPIVRIVRLDRVRISAFVSPDVVDQIKIGDSATFYSQTSPSQKPHEYRGKVVFISPERSLKIKGVQVYVQIETPKPLLRNRSSGSIIFEIKK